MKLFFFVGISGLNQQLSFSLLQTLITAANQGPDNHITQPLGPVYLSELLSNARRPQMTSAGPESSDIRCDDKKVGERTAAVCQFVQPGREGGGVTEIGLATLAQSHI